MRPLWLPLILFLPGCTFFSFGPDGVGPRPQPNASPGLYVVLAVFCLILVLSVGAALFREPRPHPHGADEKGLALILALFAGLVVLLLAG